MSVDSLEPLVGVFALRTFRVSVDGFLLPVSFVGDDWAKGFCIAGCRKAPHSAPDPQCTCGLYSLTDLHELRTQYHQADKLLAVVALEGSSIEGAMGWRSQAARVVAMWVSPHRRRGVPDVQVAAMRANYPDIAFYTDRAAMLARYPALIPPPHPRRTALADATRRTASAIRRGRMSSRSALWWAVTAAASFTVMVLLGQPKTWMTGTALTTTLLFWVFVAPVVLGVRRRRGVGGSEVVSGPAAAARRPGTAGLVALPAGPVHLVGFQRRPVRLHPGHHGPARTAAPVVPGRVRLRAAANQARRSVRTGVAPRRPFPAQATDADAQWPEPAPHRSDRRATTLRHRTTGTHPIRERRDRGQGDPAAAEHPAGELTWPTSAKVSTLDAWKYFP